MGIFDCILVVVLSEKLLGDEMVDMDGRVAFSQCKKSSR
jgi:hypothetical protein